MLNLDELDVPQDEEQVTQVELSISRDLDLLGGSKVKTYFTCH